MVPMLQSVAHANLKHRVVWWEHNVIVWLATRVDAFPDTVCLELFLAIKVVSNLFDVGIVYDCQVVKFLICLEVPCWSIPTQNPIHGYEPVGNLQYIRLVNTTRAQFRVLKLLALSVSSVLDIVDSRQSPNTVIADHVRVGLDPAFERPIGVIGIQGCLRFITMGTHGVFGLQ